jgi:Tfp pilus assembly protein FimT
VLTRVRRRLADERGLTVVEMVVTCALTLIVSVSAMAVLTGAYARNNDVQRRSESWQIARTAVDEVINRLRNQVCLDSATKPVVAATGQSITFYADFSAASPTDYPERHVLALNPATGVLSDTRYTTSSGRVADYQLAGTRVIAQGVSQVGSAPLMSFYAYDASAPPAPNRLLNTGTNAVAAADLPAIARVVVKLRATAPGKTPSKDSATVQDEAFVRIVNPTDPTPVPQCS